MGREALVAQKQRGVPRRLVGFELEGRRVPRHDMPIEREGRAVGRVTSGTFAPSLGRPLGLGYVDVSGGPPAPELTVVAGETRLAARIVKTPFYTHGSRRQG